MNLLFPKQENILEPVFGGINKQKTIIVENPNNNNENPPILMTTPTPINNNFININNLTNTNINNIHQDKTKTDNNLNDVNNLMKYTEISVAFHCSKNQEIENKVDSNFSNDVYSYNEPRNINGCSKEYRELIENKCIGREQYYNKAKNFIDNNKNNIHRKQNES